MTRLFAQRAAATGALTLATLLGLGFSTVSAAAHEGGAMAGDMGDMPGMTDHEPMAGHDHGAAETGPSFGRPGNPAQVSRTVRIDMTDTMRFTPDTITVHRGDTVRFVIHNRGQVLHEMVLGSPDVLKAHQEMMRQMAAAPADGPHHDHAHGPNMAHVPPGQTGEIVWQFTEPGPVDFACLLPGHFEAGMKGRVIVR